MINLGLAFHPTRSYNVITTKPTVLWTTERRDTMETTAETTTICTDLLERIQDLVSQDMLTDEDLASVLRLAEQMRDRRRAAS